MYIPLWVCITLFRVKNRGHRICLGPFCLQGQEADTFQGFLSIDPPPPSLQFQTELRKILVSLIEVAQKLLALNPDAVELFKKANGMKQGS